MSGQRVGLVGDERFVGAIEAAGATAVVGGAAALDGVEFVLAVGEASVTEIARRGTDLPVLVAGAAGVRSSVPSERVGAAVECALAGIERTDSLPVVAVSGAFGSARAVFDVALMSAEPARISEFAVGGPAGRIAEFRADGVVVSTPAGSGGYNRNAGGPVVAAGTGVASVVPIAPFATSAGHWILPIDAVELSVERDETPVELLIDGEYERTVEPGDALGIAGVDTIKTCVLPGFGEQRGSDGSVGD